MASHVIDWQDTPPAACQGGAVTIGNFDGVHRGHAALVAEARRQAQSLPGPAVVLTFDPRPVQLLRPDLAGPVLTTTAERCRLLQASGADEVLVLRTTSSLLNLTAVEFFQQVIRDRLQAHALVEGPTFGFGRGREGNVDTLADLCRTAHLGLTILPPQRVEGVEVSSSRVRAALTRGAVEEAALLLGRPYRLHGIVVVGSRRGRTIGFPTANLDKLQTLAPGDGVYAVRALTTDGASFAGAANLGSNPTFGEQGRKSEVHLIGFAGDLYGQPLAIDFVKRLRDTRPFAKVEELIAQLKQDVAEAARAAKE